MPGRVAEAETPRRPAFSRRPGAMRMLRRKRKGIGSMVDCHDHVDHQHSNDEGEQSDIDPRAWMVDPAGEPVPVHGVIGPATAFRFRGRLGR